MEGGWVGGLGWVAGWLGGWVAGWLGGLGWVAGWLGGWVGGWVGGGSNGKFDHNRQWRKVLTSGINRQCI